MNLSLSLKDNKFSIMAASVLLIAIAILGASTSAKQEVALSDDSLQQLQQTGAFEVKGGMSSPLGFWLSVAAGITGITGLSATAFLGDDSDSNSDETASPRTQGTALRSKPHSVVPPRTVAQPVMAIAAGATGLEGNPWDEDDDQEPDLDGSDDDESLESDAEDEVIPASSLPESMSHHSDLLSIPIAKTLETGETVHFNPTKHGNGYAIVLGAAGGGKTEFLKLVSGEITKSGVPVAVFDFHGDIKVPGLEEIIFSYTADSWAINPFAIASKDPGFGGPIVQKQKIVSMLQEICGIKHLQIDVLSEVLDEVYWDAGIKDASPVTWTQRPPSVRDFLLSLESKISALSPVEDEPQSPLYKPAISLRSAVNAVFRLPVFSGKPFDISKLTSGKSYRFNLSFIQDGKVQGAIARHLLDSINCYFKTLGEIPVQPKKDADRYRLFLVTDESKILFGKGRQKEDPFSPANVMLTEMRKYGVGYIGASQNATHFSEEGKGQVSCFIVFKHSPKVAVKKAINEDTGVPLDSLSRLAQGKGRMFFVSNNEYVEAQGFLLDVPTTTSNIKNQQCIKPGKSNVVEMKRRA